MGIFGRKPKLASRRTPKLGRDERVIAWADADGGEPVVVTNLGVFRPGHKDRLGWHEIHKAIWSGRQITITPSVPLREDDAGYLVTADGEAETYSLTEPREVPHEVRQRVTKSVAYTALHPIPGAAAVRVVARRVPGENGLRWMVRYEDGGSGGDEEVRELTAALIERGKHELH
jgi:hypothetical protein